MAITQLLGTAGNSYVVNGNTYIANSAGVISGGSNSQGSFLGIQAGDLGSLLSEGCTYAVQGGRYTYFGIVKAALATANVASVALSNGSLTIAAQPDVPRQLQFVVNPGASAITAGFLNLAYLSTDGVASTDALPLATGANTAATLVTSRGVSRLTTASVAGLTGGTSPNIQGGSNGVLALPCAVGAANIVVTMANVDGAPDSLPTQSANDGRLITPNTAPNGTHTFAFGYNFLAA